MKSTRSECLKTDKLALFSDIWNQFIEKCAGSYNLGEYLVVDEQLFPSKTTRAHTMHAKLTRLIRDQNLDAI